MEKTKIGIGIGIVLIGIVLFYVNNLNRKKKDELSVQENDNKHEKNDNKDEENDSSKKEKLITNTYTSTPSNVRSTITNVGGFYYPPYNMDDYPYGYRYSYYPQGPYLSNYERVPGFIADAIKKPKISYGVFPYGTSYNRPMLTSVVNAKDFIVGRWVKAGIAYAKNSKKPYILNVYQRALDPYREIYEYEVRDKDGFVVPINNVYLLEDKDVFDIPAYKDIGPFVFEEDKYDYIYV